MSDSLLFVGVGMRPNVQGQLAMALGRVPQIYLELWYESGLRRLYRITPDTAQNGLLVNFLPYDLDSFVRLAGGTAIDRVTRAGIIGPGLAYFESTVDLEWLVSDRTFTSHVAGTIDLHRLTPSRGNEVSYVVEQINSNVLPPERSTIIIDRSIDPILHVFGWAIDDQDRTAAGGVVVELGPVRMLARYGQDRPDIAKAFESSSYRWSGFQAAITVDGLDPGIYPLRILVLSPSKGTWYVNERVHFVDVR